MKPLLDREIIEVVFFSEKKKRKSFRIRYLHFQCFVKKISSDLDLNSSLFLYIKAYHSLEYSDWRHI